jgi:hypothetical protein
MKASEWAAVTWAQWCPTYSRGRFEIGPVVLMSRRELRRTARLHREMGRDEERRDPTPAPVDEELLATVRHLYRV